MLPKAFIIKPALILLFLVGLTHCTALPGHLSDPQRSVKSGSPYTMPARAYQSMANKQTGIEKQALLLMAAGRFIEENQLQQANAVLAETAPQSTAQLAEKKILSAAIHSRHGNPQAVITQLSSIENKDGLPDIYQKQYHELLANAYDVLGNKAYALNERIHLENYVSDEAGKIHNRRLLWLNLTQLPVEELTTLRMESDDPVLQGWIALALTARDQTLTPHALVSRLETWQQTYPSHPANALLPVSLEQAAPLLQRSPQKIALLLPLTGPLAGPGLAVRDGFIAAHQADQRHTRMQIQSYDTSATAVSSLYKQALNDGADYIIGPLTKPDATSVAAMQHPVPVLLLNEAGIKNQENVYRFGLSPQNEAAQVALKAASKGLRRALIIAPAGAWSQEVVSSFARQWRAQGGALVERLTYEDNTNLSVAVRDFLHVSEKQANAKQLRQPSVSDKALVESKRRQDFDMIFLLAYPSKARQIMPLLRYYFAADIPVYATSSVYAGNTNTLRDRDLDGIIFCDIPWVLTHPQDTRNWPEQLNSYSRLYALGMDSYALTNQLNQLILFPALGLSQQRGVLYLNPQHHVGRVLGWAQFKGGIAQMRFENHV